MSRLIQTAKFAKGTDPAADAFAGANVRSDIYNMENYDEITFVIHKGVGTSGKSTILVNTCTTAGGTGRTPIAFKYKTVTTGDTEGTLSDATDTGFTTGAGSSELYLVSVKASDLAAGDSFVELEMDEDTDNPVVGSTLAILTGARYAGDSNPTSLI